MHISDRICILKLLVFVYINIYFTEYLDFFDLNRIKTYNILLSPIYYS